MKKMIYLIPLILAVLVIVCIKLPGTFMLNMLNLTFLTPIWNIIIGLFLVFFILLSKGKDDEFNFRFFFFKFLAISATVLLLYFFVKPYLAFTPLFLYWIFSLDFSSFKDTLQSSDYVMSPKDITNKTGKYFTNGKEVSNEGENSSSKKRKIYNSPIASSSKDPKLQNKQMDIKNILNDDADPVINNKTKPIINNQTTPVVNNQTTPVTNNEAGPVTNNRSAGGWANPDDKLTLAQKKQAEIIRVSALKCTKEEAITLLENLKRVKSQELADGPALNRWKSRDITLSQMGLSRLHHVNPNKNHTTLEIFLIDLFKDKPLITPKSGSTSVQYIIDYLKNN